MLRHERDGDEHRWTGDYHGCSAYVRVRPMWDDWWDWEWEVWIDGERAASSSAREESDAIAYAMQSLSLRVLGLQDADALRARGML